MARNRRRKKSAVKECQRKKKLLATLRGNNLYSQARNGSNNTTGGGHGSGDASVNNAARIVRTTVDWAAYFADPSRNSPFTYTKPFSYTKEHLSSERHSEAEYPHTDQGTDPPHDLKLPAPDVQKLETKSAREQVMVSYLQQQISQRNDEIARLKRRSEENEATSMKPPEPNNSPPPEIRTMLERAWESDEPRRAKLRIAELEASREHDQSELEKVRAEVESMRPTYERAKTDPEVMFVWLTEAQYKAEHLEERNEELEWRDQQLVKKYCETSRELRVSKKRIAEQDREIEALQCAALDAVGEYQHLKTGEMPERMQAVLRGDEMEVEDEDCDGQVYHYDDMHASDEFDDEMSDASSDDDLEAALQAMLESV